MIWRFATSRHDFSTKFGSEVLSLDEFSNCPSSGVSGQRCKEMKDYMRTGMCDRPYSSFAWLA